MILLLEKKRNQAQIHEDGAEDEEHDAIAGRHGIAFLEQSSEEDDNPSGQGQDTIVVDFGFLRLEEVQDDAKDAYNGNQGIGDPTEISQKPAIGGEILLEDEASQDGGHEGGIQKKEADIEKDSAVRLELFSLFFIIRPLAVIEVSECDGKEENDGKDSGYNQAQRTIGTFDACQEVISLGTEIEKADQVGDETCSQGRKENQAEKFFVF